MQEKKFFQNYVLQSKEEVLTLMSLLFKDGVSTYMDEMSSNFVREEVADKDSVDFSCAYLITKELEDVISGWIDSYYTAEDLLNAEKVDDVFVSKGVKELYTKMVGDNNLEDLLHKDKEIFGSDVKFYDSDALVNMFKLLSR